MIQRNRSKFLPLTIGLILSASVAFFDALFFWDRTQIVNSLISVSLTIGFVFLSYIVSYYTIAKLLIRILRLDHRAVAISLAFLFGTIFLLISLRLSIPGSLGLDAFQLSVPIVIIMVASVASYFAAEYLLQNSLQSHKARALATAFPFLLTEIILAKMLFGGRLLLPVLIFSFLLTIWIFYRFRESRVLPVCLYVLVAVILTGPLVSLIKDRNSKQAVLLPLRQKHKIPHVLLITVDTLRSDAISAYNNKTFPTPNIDRLAKDGIIFENAISEASWTLPSISSILTGVSPLVHLVLEVNSGIPPQLPTLPEYMEKAGFQTSAIGRNPHLVQNIFRGFQTYNFFPKPKIDGLGGFVLHRFPSKLRKTDVTTSDLTDMARQWLEENKTQDFFFWLHYFDPHMPYAPPEGFLKRKSPSSRIGKKYQTSYIRAARSGFFVPTRNEREWIKELYLAEVSHVDAEIGKLMDTLKKNGLYDRSLIILTSDHGEEFWEHGSFEHGHTVYNELLRVPLIIKPPESTPKSKSNQLVSTSAIVPTILSLCGIEFLPGSFSSYSLTPFWNSEVSVFKEATVISTGQLYYEQKSSLQFEDIKYIQNQVTRREELYDLEKDPGERFSIAVQDPERLNLIRMRYSEKKEEMKQLQSRYRIKGPQQKDLTPSEIEELRSLGYLQ